MELEPCCTRPLPVPEEAEPGDHGCLVCDTHQRVQHERATRYQAMFDCAANLIAFVDAAGCLLEVNPSARPILGYERGELIGRSLLELFHPASRADAREALDTVLAQGFLGTQQLRMVRKDRTVIDTTISFTALNQPADVADRIICVVTDVSERLRETRHRGIMDRVLVALNSEGDEQEILLAVLAVLQAGTGLEAVAIRLRHQQDYPYRCTLGFPGEFVASERSLCASDPQGQPVLGDHGRPRLECLCGAVILGRIDPDRPCYTRQGSFWTNGTTRLLAEGGLAERVWRLRGRCNREGYETVALVRLHAHGEVIGLLQLNDRRPDRLCLADLVFFEALADRIGIALADRQARQALQASEARLRNVIDSQSDGIVVIDRAQGQQVLYVNAAATGLFGRSPQQLVGLPVAGLAIDGGAAELEIRDTAGSLRTVEQRAVPIEWDAREALLVTFNDVTAHKIAAETLQNRLALERFVAEIARKFVELQADEFDLGVGFTLETLGRATGVERTTLFLVSPEGQPLPDAHRWEKAGVPPLDGAPEERLCTSRPGWLEELRRGETLRVRGPRDPSAAAARGVVVAAEEEVLASLVVTPLRLREALIGFLALDTGSRERRWLDEDIALVQTVADILVRAWERTVVEEERKMFEASMRHQQKLEALGTLASGVAHEINNPINIVMNCTELILDEAEPDSATATNARNIAEASERVASIVRNLLSFARQDKEAHGSARIGDVVRQTVGLIGKVLEKDGIGLTVDVPADLPEIDCRSGQIAQVVMNLLTNARDSLNALPQGCAREKRILIRSRVLEREGQRWVRTTVEDNGRGIPAALLEQIFDPFFTTKPQGMGTGLGLSVSHGIVKEHRGELSVESREEEYARFHIDLRLDGERAAGVA